MTQKMDFLNLPEMKVSYRPLTIPETMALTSGAREGLLTQTKDLAAGAENFFPFRAIAASTSTPGTVARKGLASGAAIAMENCGGSTAQQNAARQKGQTGKAT